MKQEVINAIKPLIADKGLKEKEIDKLAGIFISLKGITDASSQEDLDNAVGDGSVIKSIASLAQTVGNRMDTDAVNRIEAKYKGYVKAEPEKQQLAEGGEASTKPQEKEPRAAENNNGISAELQKILDEQKKQIAALQEQASASVARAEASRLQSVFQSDKRIKSLPKMFAERYTLDKEENLDALAAQAEKDWAAFKQELYLREDFAAPPALSGSTSGGTDGLIARFNKMGESAAKK